MPRRIFVFDPPERFVIGAVGQPGQRKFYLQARKANELVSVGFEKIQAAALADRLEGLLGELRRRGLSIPDEVPAGAHDTRSLDEPLREEFRAGVLVLGWDPQAEEVIIEARAIGDQEADLADEPDEVDDDDPTGPDLLRVRITPTAAVAFVARTRAVVAAGRPPCPWCGQPLDPQGHFCPRRNGGRAN
ncbi:MAG: DUF3090 family protein [Chloroflexota bacterium]